MSGKIKNFLDKSGAGKIIRNIATTAVANIPGVGSGIANAIRNLPTASTPLPGSQGEKELIKSLKDIQDTTGSIPPPAVVEARAIQAIDADMSDPRFPVRQYLADPARLGGGVGKKGDNPLPGAGAKTEKVTADSVMSSLKTSLSLVVGIFLLLIVFMRIPAIKRFVMGGASYVRKSYSGYRQRRAPRRSKR